MQETLLAHQLVDDAMQHKVAAGAQTKSALLVPCIALTLLQWSRQASPDKAPFRRPWFAGLDRDFRARDGCARFRGRSVPCTTGKEAGAMATVFARPRL